MIIVTVYVDDLAIMSNSIELLNDMKRILMERFSMKDLGEIHFFLKICLKYDRENGVMVLSQRHYIKLILDEFGMLDSKPLHTPMDANTKLKPSEGSSSCSHSYPSLVGKLQYLMLQTRPDIAYAVRELSRYQQRFDEQHWKAAKRVLRYLKGTINVGLIFRRQSESGLQFRMFSDSSLGSTTDQKQHSITGLCGLLGSSLFIWQTRGQSTVSMSIMEAEFYAATETSKEILFLNELLAEMNLKFEKPFHLFVDNEGAIRNLRNPVEHSKAKHIERHYFFIREMIEKEIVDVHGISNDQQLADIFTKAVARPHLNHMCEALGIIDLSSYLE